MCSDLGRESATHNVAWWNILFMQLTANSRWVVDVVYMDSASKVKLKTGQGDRRSIHAREELKRTMASYFRFTITVMTEPKDPSHPSKHDLSIRTL